MQSFSRICPGEYIPDHRTGFRIDLPDFPKHDRYAELWLIQSQILIFVIQKLYLFCFHIISKNAQVTLPCCDAVSFLIQHKLTVQIADSDPVLTPEIQINSNNYYKTQDDHQCNHKYPYPVSESCLMNIPVISHCYRKQLCTVHRCRSHHIISIFIWNRKVISESTVHLGLNIGNRQTQFTPLQPGQEIITKSVIAAIRHNIFSMIIHHKKPCISFSTVCLSIYVQTAARKRPTEHSLNLLCLIFDRYWQYHSICIGISIFCQTPVT